MEPLGALARRIAVFHARPRPGRDAACGRFEVVADNARENSTNRRPMWARRSAGPCSRVAGEDESALAALRPVIERRAAGVYPATATATCVSTTFTSSPTIHPRPTWPSSTASSSTSGSATPTRWPNGLPRHGLRPPRPTGPGPGLCGRVLPGSGDEEGRALLPSTRPTGRPCEARWRGWNWRSRRSPRPSGPRP